MIFWGDGGRVARSRPVQCCNVLSPNGNYYDSDYDYHLMMTCEYERLVVESFCSDTFLNTCLFILHGTI